MPASKPAFDAALDGGNALTTGIVWASWFAEDEAYPTRLTDVSGNANHGTLTGLDPARRLIVSGGTPSGYNQTYNPSGDKWVSADGLYQLSHDDMGKSWILCPLNDLWSSVAYNYYEHPWEGTWSASFTVVQGDAVPGPWFDDGLQFNGSGIVEVGDISNDLQPGTGNFSLTFHYTLGANPTVGGPDTLFYWSPSTADPGYTSPLVSVLRWAGEGGWDADPLMRIDIRDGAGNIAWEVFPGSGAAWAQNTCVIITITFDRSGYAKLYINGTYISQQTISHVSGSLSGMAVCNFGKFGTGWAFNERLNTVLYHQGEALTAAQAATIAADIYDLAAASGETAVALAGEATGTATSAGQLSIVAGLAGAATGTATSSGQFGLIVDLAGDATGDATSAADLTPVEADVEELAGAATGDATSSGELSLVVGLTGTATGTATSAGQLSIVAGLAGAATGDATSTGSLTLSVPPEIVRWNTIKIGSDGENFFSGSIDEFVMDANVRVLDDFPIVKDVSGPNDTIFWPFAENTGNYVFSGRILGETLELHGGTWTTGRTRYGVSFDGVDDYGVCTPAAESFAGRTLSVEVGIKFLSDEATPIITQLDGINISYDGNGGILAALGGVTNPTSVVGRLTAQNEWTNVCIVYDGSQKELWVNGQKTGVVASTGTASLTANPLYVATDETNYGNVVIDRIRIYRGRLRPYTRTVKRFMPGQSSFAANADWIME